MNVLCNILAVGVSYSVIITLDNKFQFFLSVMNMLLIYLFTCMKLEKGHN